MELTKALRERRSIRKFKSDSVSREMLEGLLETALWAPSGRNTQNWKFAVLTGKKKDQFLRLSESVIEHVDPELRELFNDKMRLFIHGYFRDCGGAPAIIVAVTENSDKPEVSAANMQSAAAALYNLMLLAHEAGLGTCWMTGHMAVEQQLMELIGCEGYRLVGVTPIGYPDQTPPVPPRKAGKILWLDE